MFVAANYHIERTRDQLILVGRNGTLPLSQMEARLLSILRPSNRLNNIEDVIEQFQREHDSQACRENIVMFLRAVRRMGCLCVGFDPLFRKNPHLQAYRFIAQGTTT